MLNPYGDGTIILQYKSSNGYAIVVIRDTVAEWLDGNAYNSYYYAYSGTNMLPVHSWGPYTLFANSNSSYQGLLLHVRTPYLATINNLTTPVTKTSAQTMKITYTITES